MVNRVVKLKQQARQASVPAAGQAGMKASTVFETGVE